MPITNQHLLEAFTQGLTDLRLEIKDDMEKRDKEIGVNTAFRNNLSGKIAIGVLAIGTFVSAITGIIVTFINNRISK